MMTHELLLYLGDFFECLNVVSWLKQGQPAATASSTADASYLIFYTRQNINPYHLNWHQPSKKVTLNDTILQLSSCLRRCVTNIAYVCSQHFQHSQTSNVKITSWGERRSGVGKNTALPGRWWHRPEKLVLELVVVRFSQRAEWLCLGRMRTFLSSLAALLLQASSRISAVRYSSTVARYIMEDAAPTRGA
jgi:hypothetical protein